MDMRQLGYYMVALIFDFPNWANNMLKICKMMNVENLER